MPSDFVNLPDPGAVRCFGEAVPVGLTRFLRLIDLIRKALLLNPSIMAETVNHARVIGLVLLTSICGHHVFDSDQETSMNVHKSVIKIAATLSISLLAAAFAHAQGLSAATGSTDIYTVDFQRAYPSASMPALVKGGSIVTESTDIWATDFQKLLATQDSIRNSPTAAAYSGSTDIYTTNFQRSYM